jgi:hypothetical protein
MNKVMRWSVAVVIGAMSAVYLSGAVEAQAPKRKPVLCKALKEESACKTRDDCAWVSAVMDATTQKERRKAHCRARPKSRTMQ